MFKKSILAFLVLSLVTTTIFASSKKQSDEKKEKEKGSFFNRVWELGVTADVGIANNYFEILDFFQPTIVIDFNDMYDSVGVNGLTLDLELGAHIFSNVLTKKFSFGFDIGFDPTINMAISKDFIDFIANGNELDETQTLTLGVAAEAFLDVVLPVNFKLGKLLAFSVSPAYFLPVVYMPYTPIGVDVTMGSDGSIVAKGETEVALYSILPIDSFTSGTFSTSDILPLLGKGGFDISVAGTFQLLPSIKLGASAKNIPIVPSKVNAQYKYKVSVDFETDSLVTDLLSSDTDSGSESEGESSETDSSSSSGLDFSSMYSFEQVDVTEVAAINVFRPLKFGFWAEWQIFGNDLLVLTPFVQMRFLDATVGNAAGFGFDYALSLSTDIKFLRSSFTTSYIDNIFKQKLFLALNCRILEVDISISSQATTFVKSFVGSGVGVGVGVILGF